MSDLQKNGQLTHSLIFCERPERFAHDHSFPLSNMSNSLTSLIFGERPERPKRPLLIKKEGMSEKRMSKFPALAIATHFDVLFKINC